MILCRARLGVSYTAEYKLMSNGYHVMSCGPVNPLEILHCCSWSWIFATTSIIIIMSNLTKLRKIIMLMCACAVYLPRWSVRGKWRWWIAVEVSSVQAVEKNYVFSRGGSFRSKRKNVTHDTNLFRRFRLMQDKRTQQQETDTLIYWYRSIAL